MTTPKGAYASALRQAMHERRWTMRDLQKRTNYSYEHIRKVLRGLPLMSEKFNVDVCGVLGLDSRAMWELALREKLEGKFGSIGSMLLPDGAQALKSAWAELTEEQKAQVSDFATQLANANRASRSESDRSVQQIRDEIEVLSRKLHRLEKKPRSR
jgi:hypothetical protein